MRKRRNLLIVCAGDNSLHKDWFRQERSYDILTIYYGDNPDIARLYESSSDLFFRRKGMKVELARQVLVEDLYFKNRFKFSDYSLVWFPDDDLKFPQSDEQIEDLFSNAAAVNADVFQPAICNEHTSKEWEATKQIPGAYAHRTNIVEIMAHGFSGEAFEKCYLAAVHTCDFMKSGWGLESIWMKIGEAAFGRSMRTFVLDCVAIIHTRPVGSGASLIHEYGIYEMKYTPQAFTNRMRTYRTYSGPKEILVEPASDLNLDMSAVDVFHALKFLQHIEDRTAR
jgi:hypothetical protein